MMKKWLVLLVSGIWMLPVHAEKAYKWTDADGNVQITQTPPPTGAKDIKQMDLPKALMPTTPPSLPKTTSSEKKEEKKESLPKQPTVDISKMTPEQLHEHNCSNAKRHLDLLKNTEQVAIPEKGTNKLQLVSPEQREVEIKKAEASVDKFCNAPPPAPIVDSNAQPQNATPPSDKKPEDGTEKKPENTGKK